MTCPSCECLRRETEMLLAMIAERDERLARLTVYLNELHVQMDELHKQLVPPHPHPPTLLHRP